MQVVCELFSEATRVMFLVAWTGADCAPLHTAEQSSDRLKGMRRALETQIGARAVMRAAEGEPHAEVQITPQPSRRSISARHTCSRASHECHGW
eukprot:5776701-Pleurochrysis_carterae.AAC.1